MSYRKFLRTFAFIAFAIASAEADDSSKKGFKPFVIDSDLVNELNAFSPKSEEGKIFQAEMEDIYRDLYGEKRLIDDKPQFLLIDDASSNAFILTRSKPPIMGLTQGALKLCENRDQIAAFFHGHEVAHYEYRLRLGATRKVNKLEEQGADLRAVEVLRAAGYDPTQAYEIQKKVLELEPSKKESKKKAKKNSKVSLMKRVFSLYADPHPIDAERLRALRVTLTGLEARFGRLKREPRPLGESLERLKTAKRELDPLTKKFESESYRALSPLDRARELVSTIRSHTDFSEFSQDILIEEIRASIRLLNISLLEQDFDFNSDEGVQNFADFVVSRNRAVKEILDAVLGFIKDYPQFSSQIYIEGIRGQYEWQSKEVALLRSLSDFVNRSMFNSVDESFDNGIFNKAGYASKEDQKRYIDKAGGSVQPPEDLIDDYEIVDIDPLQEIEVRRSINLAFRFSTEGRKTERALKSGAIARRPSFLVLPTGEKLPTSLELPIPSKLAKRFFPNEAKEGQQGSFELSEDVARDLLNQKVRLEPDIIPEISSVIGDLNLLMEENTLKGAERLAERILQKLDALPLSAEVTERAISAIPKLKKDDIVPWNKAIGFAAQSEKVARALWRMGVEDQRLYRTIPHDLAAKYLLNEPGYSIHFDPHRALHVQVSKDGRVEGFSRGSLTEAKRDRRGEWAALVQRPLFVAAYFDASKREALLNLLREFDFEGLKIEMIGFLAELPDHFFELNKRVLSNHAENASDAKLVGELSKLLKTKPESARALIRRIFVGSDESLFAKYILTDGKRLEDKSEYIEFVANLPQSIMSANEKLLFLWATSPLDKIEDPNFRISILRDIFGEKGPSLQEVSELARDIEKFDSTAYRALVEQASEIYFVKHSIDPNHDLVPFLQATRGRVLVDIRRSLGQLALKWTPPKEIKSRVEGLAAILSAGLYQEDPQHFDSIIEGVLKEVVRLEAPALRSEALLPLIRDAAIANPFLRNQLQDIYSQTVLEILGPDDGSERYAHRLRELLKDWGSIDSESKIGYINALADRLFLQPQTLERLRDGIKNINELTLAGLNQRLLLNEVVQIILQNPGEIVAAVQGWQSPLVKPAAKRRGKKGTEEQTSKDSIYTPSKTLAEPLLEFLSQPFATDESVLKFLSQGGGLLLIPSERVSADLIRTRFSITKSIDSYDHVDRENRINDRFESYVIAEPLANPPRHDYMARARLLYDNFWASTLPARAVYLDSVMHPEGHVKEDDIKKSLEIVFDRVLPESMKFSAEARRLMTNYVSVLPEYQRGLFIASLMAADRASEQTGAKGLGARLGLLLDIKGPAEAKLGQGMHSFPETPEEIRDGLGSLKSDRRISRFEILETYKRRIPQGLRDQISHVGRDLGVASYYVVIEVTMKSGEKKAIRMLRMNAAEQADLGFEYMLELAEKEGASEVAQVLKRMIEQAKRMSATETNTETGRAQTLRAEAIYKDVQIRIGNKDYEFKTYPFEQVGPGWAMLELAPGVRFNKLEDSLEKRQLAEAYLRFELEQILSGELFDHDRHGDQMLVAGNRISILDHGGLAIHHEPDREDRLALGRTLAHMLENQKGGELASRSQMIRAFEDNIKAVGADGHARDYLISVQRALLALGDFTRAINPKDEREVQKKFAGHLRSIFENQKVHPEILEGAVEIISLNPHAAQRMMEMSTTADVCSKGLADIHIRRSSNSPDR